MGNVNVVDPVKQPALGHLGGHWQVLGLQELTAPGNSLRQLL
jgi:hypothetical protein